MELINGKQLALDIQEEMRIDVESWSKKGHRLPHLVAILVGDNPASASYVRNKMRSCERTGIKSTLIKESSAITEAQLLTIIDQLNKDENVDGFIVQLPLPEHISEDKVTLAIAPNKDVDGFHPTNFGLMAQGMPQYIPATPFGMLTMLERYNIETSGKHCVVIGRSNIVGTPMSILMSRKAKVGNCTVTLTHSRTQNLAEEIRRADIIVAAIGIPNFVTADMVKDGAVILDVGINSVEDSSRKRGYRLVGDVDFEGVAPKCSFITPVPGGVGPMTVTALIMNTLKSYKKYHLNQELS
ncbi:bifunctional methylenetetrahydrofolate dehydrogenase/methenyltetrahydrofolate cyclohydrolase FolD [Aureispira anguillae]|uniref:Bifunctional protein FolD n=1 Tax=Aureispira anguillae TaxID=2864201 RepID=A0A915YGI5_9BACT|nr:bifunctional methylenetetrahydrofolate dehydrogenase/methenyltetrahydrofolate cyclohydrolase FolD [Aureispira anguillae]BDS12622.1 bifunctional methylenetetrahydrofolate dehydrogenase/methenyltetrahydrofolate cyclohydrolase FolD [Aureispira anguillae]